MIKSFFFTFGSFIIFSKRSMDNKAVMEIATRNEEEKNREDSTLASCVRIWKRKHDVARFTENRRTAVLSTLHENQISTESVQVKIF